MSLEKAFIVLLVVVAMTWLWRRYLRRNPGPPDNLGPGHPRYDSSWEAYVRPDERPHRHSFNRR